MDNEPMSEERLAEIRSRYLTPVEIMRDTLSVPHAYEVDIADLLAEVEHLRAKVNEHPIS